MDITPPSHHGHVIARYEPVALSSTVLPSPPHATQIVPVSLSAGNSSGGRSPLMGRKLRMLKEVRK